MTVDCEGELAPREKIRTKKRAISEMAKTVMAHVQDGANYSGKCIMSHSACREDAEAVAALIEEQVPQLKGKIEINSIGALIGWHGGALLYGRQARGLTFVGWLTVLTATPVLLTFDNRKRPVPLFAGRTLLLRLAFLSTEEETV